MCGICGIFAHASDEPVSADLLNRMTDILVHRGPDDRGVHWTARVGLGVRRLSIIDVAGGHQPIYNEDQSRCLVYNGEVYNHAELRDGLEAKGHQFRTRCDTEVVLHLYEEYGPGCVEQLNGEFAFAIWDAEHEQLFLARDRLGIRPLYYTFAGGRFLFASEMKAILLDDAVPRRVNPQALADLLSLGYILPGASLFENIQPLPQGHWMTVRAGSQRLQQYWDIPFEHEAVGPAPKRPQVYADELRALLTDAVRMRLMSDVPLGVFLSGGVDSSGIVSLAAPASATPLKTFVSRQVEWPDFDEAPFARAVADQYHTEHHELVFRGQALPDALPRLLWHLDEPRAGPGALPQMQVAQLASEFVKVGLGGQGGDEVFGGYARFALCRWPRTLAAYLSARLHRPAARDTDSGPSVPTDNMQKQLDRRAVGSLARHALSFLMPSHQRHYQHLSIVPPRLLPGLLNADVAAALDGYTTYGRYLDILAQSGARDPLNRLLYFETKTYLNALLMVDDRTSMAASLETRPPFLDHRIVEYAATIPSDLKVHGLISKYILKLALAPGLPDRIVNRKKQGFPTPFEHWVRGELRDWVFDHILGHRARQRGLFDHRTLTRIVRDEQLLDPRVWERAIWVYLCIELWARLFLDGDGLRMPPTVASAQARQTAPLSPAGQVAQ